MRAQINNLAFVGHIFIFFTFGFSESKRSELSENHFFPWENVPPDPPPKKGVEDDVCVLWWCVFFADVFFRVFLGSFEKVDSEKG